MCDARYGWTAVCQQRFGAVRAQILHERNTAGERACSRAVRAAPAEHADPFTTAVRTTLKTLRQKLGKPDPIITVVGRGYRLR